METHGIDPASSGLGGNVEKRLFLARLALSRFRNYAEATLAPGPASVVLTGDNGAGKTNILEAVSMLSPGRGLRGATFADMAPLGGDGAWAVSARLSVDGEETAIGTGQQPAPGNMGGQGGAGSASRIVKIDGETMSGSGALGEYVQILWLIPAMDGLFTGPASDRRRFLDRMAAAFDSSHRTRLTHFERAMRQRNRLFEMGERSARYFEAIEAQMAEIATAIAAGRIEAMDRLAAHIAASTRVDNAFPHAVLALEGVLEADLRDTPAVDVEDAYARQLGQFRERDRAAGRTLDGPHRSDLLVRHGPKDMPAHLSSTGEQKALLIGLILAHAKAVKEAHAGLAPLLLLDEIAAHLDELRREALFDEIERLGTQAWLTGTDVRVFAPLQDKAQFFTVANGTVTADGGSLATPLRQVRTG
ncbi:MAG: DNA replication/repair protein RecF [Alphaproteobacteria bacterium]